MSQRNSGKREVFHAAQGLYAVVGGIGYLASARETVLLAPGPDPWRRPATELFTGCAQPRTETPRDVASHAVKELGLRSADFVDNRPRNLPHTRWGEGDGRAG